MESGVYQIWNFVNGRRYIGSSKNIRKRWNIHRSTLNTQTHDNINLQNDWNKYGKENFDFSVIEYCQEEELIQVEEFYIDLWKPSYNMTPHAGNSLGYKHTEESCQKISLAMKGRKRKPYTLETRKKLSIALTGRKFSEEHRKNISLARTGTKASPETRAKLSAVFKGKTKSPEHQAKITAALKGKKFTPEHREAIRLSWEKRKNPIP